MLTRSTLFERTGFELTAVMGRSGCRLPGNWFGGAGGIQVSRIPESQEHGEMLQTHPPTPANELSPSFYESRMLTSIEKP